VEWFSFCHVCHDGFAFEWVVHCKYYNEMGYKSPWEICFPFSVVLLVVGIIEHRGQCSPKGDGFVIASG